MSLDNLSLEMEEAQARITFFYILVTVRNCAV
jgi:hypothetical protein